MNYKQFQTQKLKESIQIDPQDSILTPTLIEKIERIINKPIPQELMDFYCFCDGLEWENTFEYTNVQAGMGIPSKREKLASLATMFDNYRTQPDLEFENWDDEEDAWGERSEYFHQSIYLEDLSPYDNEKLDISTDEGRRYFWILSNMKLVCDFNGHEGTIVIDFTDTQKPYQLYYQVYGDLYPLELSLEKFYSIFLQIGLTDFWFTAYMREEDQENTCMTYSKETHHIIQHFYPDFDLGELPPL